jgi:hypothetical protein
MSKRPWIETRHLDPVPLCNRRVALVLCVMVLTPWAIVGIAMVIA